MRRPRQRTQPLARAVWLHDALRDAPPRSSSAGPRARRARPSSGTARPAPRAPRPKARPTGACSTRCGITRVGWPSGTWWAGVCTVPTISSPAAPAIGSAGRARRATTRPIRRRCSGRSPATASRDSCESGWTTARTDGPLLEQSRRLAHPPRARRRCSCSLAVARYGGSGRAPPRARPGARLRRCRSPRERITVEVLNGTRRQGLARVATRVLREQGSTSCSSATPTRSPIPPGWPFAVETPGGERMSSRRSARAESASSPTRSVGWT